MNHLDRIDSDARRTNRRRAWLGLGLLAGLVVAAITLPLADWLIASRSWIAAHNALGALLFLLAFVVLTVAMVPGSILIACGGYLFGLEAALPLVSAGVGLGALASAWLARTLARGWLSRKFADDPRYLAIEKAVTKKGFLIVTLTRLSLLMPFNVLNIIYGLSRMPLRTMAVATWIGMTPAVLLYSYLGSVAANVEQIWSREFDNDWVGKAIVVSGLVMIAVVTWVIHRTATRALRHELQSED